MQTCTCRLQSMLSSRPLLRLRYQSTVQSPAATESAYLPRKSVNSPKFQRPSLGARHWKELFVASNYGKDFEVPSGPKGKAEKLIKREELRKKAAESETALFDLAKQHFKPEQLATAHQKPTFDRKSYLSERGPYRGRNIGESAERAFKGHKWQARKRERVQDIKGRMIRMDAQIADAKRVRLEQQQKRKKPSLPF